MDPVPYSINSLIKQDLYRQTENIHIYTEMHDAEKHHSLSDLPVTAQPNPAQPSTAVFPLTQRQHFALPWAWAVFCSMQKDSHGHPVTCLLGEILVEVKQFFVCSSIQWNRYLWHFSIIFFDFVTHVFPFYLAWERREYGRLFIKSLSYSCQMSTQLKVYT